MLALVICCGLNTTKGITKKLNRYFDQLLLWRVRAITGDVVIRVNFNARDIIFISLGFEISEKVSLFSEINARHLGLIAIRVFVIKTGHDAVVPLLEGQNALRFHFVIAVK